MNLGKSFSDSWNIFTKNFITIVLAMIVATLLSFVTIFILAVPLFIGFQMMLVKGLRGEKVEFNEIFGPMKDYFKLVGAAFWIGIAEVAVLLPGSLCIYLNWLIVGGILILVGIIADIYMWVTWMFTLLLLNDKGLTIKQGLKASRDLVLKNNFWMHLLLIILVGILTQIGNMLWLIGALLTTPIAIGAVAAAYVEETK